MTYKMPTETSRQTRLETLLQYYLHNLVEDPIDGSPLDEDVIQAITKLKEKYQNND